PRETGLDDRSGGRLAQGLGQERHRARLVPVQRLAEQLLLVPEGGVEAGSVDPHGPGQLRERGALVPACPEHLQGPVQCLIHVELSRAPRWHGHLLSKKSLSALDRQRRPPVYFIVSNGTLKLKGGNRHDTQYTE